MAGDVQTAVWTGTPMLIWLVVGGDGCGLYSWELCGKGARYNPGSDTWVPIPTYTSWDRTAYTAVWDGTELIFWGGEMYDYSVMNLGFYNDGLAYNPTTNSWNALPTRSLARSWRTACQPSSACRKPASCRWPSATWLTSTSRTETPPRHGST